jgi:hypothetical protein
MEWGNRIHQCKGFLRIVSVRAGQANRERHAPSVANQMTLAPALGPICGIRTGLIPAVHRADGTTVYNRPRPINLVVAREPIQQREVDRSEVPASCQSRNRRQHVIPDPHPSSCGSICQGMPLRRTKTMPVRHARSGTRGLPPFGRRGGIGRNGSTRSHNGSGSSAAAIPVHVTAPPRVKLL